MYHLVSSCLKDSSLSLLIWSHRLLTDIASKLITLLYSYLHLFLLILIIMSMNCLIWLIFNQSELWMWCKIRIMYSTDVKNILQVLYTLLSSVPYTALALINANVIVNLYVCLLVFLWRINRNKIDSYVYYSHYRQQASIRVYFGLHQCNNHGTNSIFIDNCTSLDRNRNPCSFLWKRIQGKYY